MKKIAVTLLSGLWTLPALAQTGAPAARLNLSTLLRQATEAARTAEASFREATGGNNGKPFDACKAELLDFTASYHQWFVDHFAEFQRRDQDLSTAYAQISQKIESLKSVQMLQVESQADRKEISLRTVTEFLAILNQRLATAPADQLDLVIAQMEKPRYNPTGATFAQIKDAVRIMTTNLNAQLKEKSATYRLEFTQRERAYDLDFVMSVGGAKDYRFSLLSTSQGSLTDEMRLQLIASSADKIDGYSPDSAKRYFEMYEKMVSPQCQDERIAYYDYENTPVAKPFPWLSPAVVVQAIPSESSVSVRQESLIRKYKISFRSDDIYLDEKRMSFGGTTDAKFVEINGTLHAFAVYQSVYLWYHNGSNWKQLGTGSYRTLKVVLIKGKPAVLVQTAAGTQLIDTDGRVVTRN